MLKYGFIALIPTAFILTGCVESAYRGHHEQVNPFLRPFTDPVYAPNEPWSWHNRGQLPRQTTRNNQFEEMLMWELFGPGY